jgi:hypothetical protein
MKKKIKLILDDSGYTVKLGFNNHGYKNFLSKMSKT